MKPLTFKCCILCRVLDDGNDYCPGKPGDEGSSHGLEVGSERDLQVWRGPEPSYDLRLQRWRPVRASAVHIPALQRYFSQTNL